MALPTDPSMDPAEQQWSGLSAKLAAELIAPDVLTDELAHRFRKDVFRRFADYKIPSLAHSVENGGGGQPHRAYYACLEQIARVCPGFAVSVSVTNIAQGAIADFGTTTQIKHYLHRLTAGEWLGAFSLSEHGSGSDAASLKLQASKVEGGYCLNGTKLWCTSASDADLFLVIARTSEHKTNGISAFLVPSTAEGFKIGKLESKMGLWSSSVAELIFDRAFVPGGDMLGEPGEGFTIALSQLDAGRIAIGTIGLGIAFRCIELAFGVTVDRQSRSNTDESAHQAQLAAYYARALAMRAMIREAAQLRDHGAPTTGIASAIKLLGSDLAVEASGAVLEIIGRSSALQSNGIERYFRDAKALQIVEGTNQIQQLVLSRELRKKF